MPVRPRRMPREQVARYAAAASPTTGWPTDRRLTVFDFPTTPAIGTVVTVPDGSYRVWDSTKWKAAPSGSVIYPPGSYLPQAGGQVCGPIQLVDSPAPGGAFQSIRTIPFTTPSNSQANQPFELIHTFTGANLDTPTSSTVLAASLTN